jgi:heat-inducible transcriptional repressor
MVLDVTERQKRILETVIREYIKLAEPVSSEKICSKYDFNLSSATIRGEMHCLTKKQYLYQPYLSSGRIPTDKGYRFFVDELLKKKTSKEIQKRLFERLRREESSDSLRFLQEVTRTLASFSSNLALTYLCKERICLKEGWEELLKEPEFQDPNILGDLTAIIKDLEREIERLFTNNSLDIKVFIGRENFISRAREFSLIISQGKIKRREKIGLAILGPKRMLYQKNISLIKSLTRFLKNF